MRTSEQLIGVDLAASYELAAYDQGISDQLSESALSVLESATNPAVEKLEYNVRRYRWLKVPYGYHGLREDKPYIDTFLLQTHPSKLLEHNDD